MDNERKNRPLGLQKSPDEEESGETDPLHRLKNLTDVFDLQTEMRLMNRGLSWRFNLHRNEQQLLLLAQKEKERSQALEFLREIAAREYAERVQRLTARLDELDRASLEALREADRRVRENEERLRRIRETATVTPDGRRIYRTEDGMRAYYEDGIEATAREMDAVQWEPYAPSWERHQESVRNLDQSIQKRDDIRTYRERLEHHRKHLENRDDPLRADELDEMEREINVMPEAVNRHLAPSSSVRTSAASEYTQDEPLRSAPDASKSFARTAARRPDHPPETRTPTAPVTGPDL